MKKLIKILGVVVALSGCSASSYQKNELPSWCNKYIVNIGVKDYTDSIGVKFRTLKELNYSNTNVIMTTKGQSINVIHIEIFDSAAVLKDYFYRDKSFILKETKTMTFDEQDSLNVIEGYYQFDGCDYNSHSNHKCLSLYVEGQVKFKVLYERVPYSNERLSSTPAFAPLINLLKKVDGSYNVTLIEFEKI